MAKVIINGRQYQTTLQDGREVLTFTADRDFEQVFVDAECLGEARFSKIQIEKNNEMTDFVVPEVSEGTLSGLFKDIKGLELEMTDTANSELWGKIRLYSDGLLTTFKNGAMTTAITATARGIRQEMADKERELQTSITSTAQGIRTELSNKERSLKAEITSTAQGVREAFEAADRGLTAEFNRTAQGIRTELSNKERSLKAEITSTAQGVRTELSNRLTGLSTTTQATADGLATEIRDRKGAVARTQESVDGLIRRLASAEGSVSQLTQTANGLSISVADAKREIKSNYTQLKGLIDLSVNRGDVSGQIQNSGDAIMAAIRDKGGDIVSAINLSRSGARITGSQIYLDGNTTVNGSFASKVVEATSIRADKITSGTLDAGRINVVGLNANRIVGLDANFIKARIQHVIADLLEGEVLRASNGAMAIDLNNAGITFERNATINFNSENNALVRRKGTHTAFIHFADVSSRSDGGVGSLYASFGVTSSGDGVNSASSGRFSGIRVFRGARGYEHDATLDQIEVYGDKILFSDDFAINRGFKMRTDNLRPGQWIDLNKMYEAVLGLTQMWGHFANAGGALADLLRNRSNHNVNTAIDAARRL